MITGSGILDITVIRDDRRVVLLCSGELDIASEEALADAVFDALHDARRHLVLDYRPLRFTDTTALRIYELARTVGGVTGIQVTMMKGPAVARVASAVRETM